MTRAAALDCYRCRAEWVKSNRRAALTACRWRQTKKYYGWSDLLMY
jgi:hypothetical protein